MSGCECEAGAPCDDVRMTATREVGVANACAAVDTSALRCADGVDAESCEVMDVALARRLCDLTSEFYRANAESFSQTRQTAWQGWARALQAAGVAGGAELGKGAFGESLCVLDLACGNLRFERYVAQQLPEVPLACYAVDNCEPLVEDARVEELSRVAFQKLNVIDALAAGSLTAALDAPLASCDLAVSFGFMHHVPLERWRVELLRALMSRVHSGGHVAVSFWRFLNSEKLAKKARETTAQAHVDLGIPKLPPNDFLLGWQETRGLYRYCHHFDEREIDCLLSVVADVASPIARFSADGKTGNLNEYVVLQVR